jgi:hypothetical protein
VIGFRQQMKDLRRLLEFVDSEKKGGEEIDR